LKPVKRQLLFQGERDGACFLYAIANAFICLTNKQPKQRVWDKAINQFPKDYRADFLRGLVGTDRLFENEDVLRELIERVLNCFANSTTNNFAIKYHKDITTKADVGQLIGEKSVVLFCYEDEHWVIGTAYDKKTKPSVLYIACSAQFYEEANCIEACDPVFKRPCNALTKRAGLKCPGTVFQITRTK